MADTDWTPEELASGDRIPRYNVLDPANGGDDYSFGGDGYIDNQMRQAKDVQVIGKAARRFSLSALAQALLSKQESDDATAERIAAQNAASTAYKWANASENEEVEPGKFSAFHFMRKALGFSTSAKTDADRAQGYAQGLNVPALNASTALQYLRANAGGTAYEFAAVDLYSASLINRVARTANTALAKADKGALIDITSGTFTQAFAAAAALGAGWFAYVRNAGTGDITLDPNGSETIDGLTSFVMYPGEARLVQCDGTALRSIVLEAGSRTFTSSANFIVPPGINGLIVEAIGGGAGGNSGFKGGLGSQDAFGGTGGGGGERSLPAVISPPAAGASIPVVVGSGGAGGSATSTSNTGGGGGVAGGDSSFGSLVKAKGGSTGGNGGTSTRNSTAGGSAIGSEASYSGYPSEYGGAGGTSSGTSTYSGGSSLYGGGGGGAGGHVQQGSTFYPATSGGETGTYRSQSTAGTGGSAGIGSSSSTPATAGSNGADGQNGLCGRGGGGGGAANHNSTGSAGKGGDGGNPGGGGGGGGGLLFSATDARATGAGGNGGRGEVRVRMF